MSREIKFRAWDEATQNMSLQNTNKWYELFSRSLTAFEFLSDGPVKLMQYTGLKDRNGVEIYEGDIIQIESVSTTSSLSCQTEICQIIFANGSFMTNEPPHFPVNTLSDALAGYDVSVVGNIYESPELLN